MILIKPTRIEPIFINGNDGRSSFTVRWDTYIDLLNEKVNDSAPILKYSEKYDTFTTPIDLVIEDESKLFKTGRPFEIDTAENTGWTDNARIGFRVINTTAGLTITGKAGVTITGTATVPALSTGYL